MQRYFPEGLNPQIISWSKTNVDELEKELFLCSVLRAAQLFSVQKYFIWNLCVPLNLLCVLRVRSQESSVCFASVRLPCLKFKGAVNKSYQFKYMSLASGLIREGNRSDHLPCPLLEHTRRRQSAPRSTLAHAHTHKHALRLSTNIFPISS